MFYAENINKRMTTETRHSHSRQLTAWP